MQGNRAHARQIIICNETPPPAKVWQLARHESRLLLCCCVAALSLVLCCLWLAAGGGGYELQRLRFRILQRKVWNCLFRSHTTGSDRARGLRRPGKPARNRAAILKQCASLCQFHRQLRARTGLPSPQAAQHQRYHSVSAVAKQLVCASKASHALEQSLDWTSCA